MEHDETPRTGLTRRDYVKYGGAAVGGGLLAGCTGGNDSESTADGETDAPTQTATEAATETGTESPADGSYSVTMSPVGTVEFDEPPQSIFTRLTHHAGMAFALGRGDDVNAVNGPAYYDATWKQFTARLPGVEVDWADLYPSWETSKEKLYELDSDVHLADPAWVVQLEQWDMADIEEVAENISPWFGNSLSARHASPTDEWTGDYEYYTLWEQFEKVAQMLREEERYEALAAVHDDVLATIEAGLPPEDERPSVVLLTASDIENQVWAYTVGNPGFMTSHIRPLAPHDAFEGSIESGSTVDFEALLEADPDVLLFLSGMQPSVSMNDLRATLESDPVAAEISAVQNGRVYPQGARYQGPILNLFQLEMSAKQFYPEAFGEWPTSDGGPYPEIPEDEQLFDRQHVADIINGEF
ncbi:MULTISPECIES: ABC transporter substrate-binding protein [Haloferax]|uniref:ABC transporter substrate-binding protein n=1 Tax=Haloferax sp. Atlit-48N TaxID=2077198 RepID=A0ACD5HVX4_9EURY|nr:MULTISPECIES: ABC transporter substrate-binding protein [Haloferax]MBC9986696.1 ABC transporter substrate-binding protein [Haloferax sp. AS1]RDZ39084.1 ABC transporter substrate-binding protein [Haloferax sp. Atlit-47N]WEL30104.1 ABC-type Fe3 -hydroxamate transport system, periplasmic component [Haloferax alexandrinus]